MDSEIQEHFNEMGVEVKNEILDKCVELCTNYNIDPAEFVEEWMAFSITNLNNAEPTISYLLEMERKSLNHKTGKKSASSGKNDRLAQITELSHLSEGNPLSIYGGQSISAPIAENAGILGDEEEIMDSYNCKTPKASKSALSRLTTPARHNDSRFSPISYSPISGTPKTHSGNSGKIVYTFGNSALVKKSTWTSNNETHEKITIKQISTYKNELMTSKSKYMLDTLLEKSLILGDHVFNIGKEICKKVFGPEATDYDIVNADVPSQETVKVIGRICCDFDGKLDAASTILVDADDMKCRTVRLNFSKTKSFGIFPGQTVMVQGVNPRGEIMFVEEIFSERIISVPAPPKLTNDISFLIAAGPYTHDDDLVYDPLQELVTYCKDHRPDVLIMIGPFMEADHSLITSNILAETFESFFEKMLAGIIDAVGNETTICLISSSKDAFSSMVYPTHPISLKKTYPNVYTLPDPSIIDINGSFIGVTSTDIVDHLMMAELSINSGDKVKRVVNYLFHQQSFYPLTPPPLDVSFDSGLANKFAKLDFIPNIMILPSSQKCFIRDVNSCLSINPGRLADKNGGTFTRLMVYPPKDDETNPFHFMACQIMKV